MLGKAESSCRGTHEKEVIYLISNDREYRSFSMKSISEDNRIIEGYAIIFEAHTVLYHDECTGTDYGEIISRNALNETDMSDVVLTVNHEGTPIARTRNGSLKLQIDDRGLKITAELSGSEEAKDNYQKIKSGLLDRMSFAFDIPKDGISYDECTHTQRVEKIRTLYDVAVVTKPAYEQTSVFARNKFEALAEPDRVKYRKALVRTIANRIETRVAENRKQGRFEGPIEQLCTRPELEEMEKKQKYFQDHKDCYQGFIKCINDAPSFRDKLEAIISDMCSISERWKRDTDSQDIEAAQKDELRISELEKEYRETVQQNHKTIETFGQKMKHENSIRRKDENTMEIEKRDFYKKFTEERAAGTASTMTAVIPETITNQYVAATEENSFLQDATVTSIEIGFVKGIFCNGV